MVTTVTIDTFVTKFANVAIIITFKFINAIILVTRFISVPLVYMVSLLPQLQCPYGY